MTDPAGAPAAPAAGDQLAGAPQARPRADEADLRRLYLAHGAVLLRYLMRITRGDRHHAEDMVQETLLRAWRHPEAQTENGEWSLPWLFTVARRIAIDHVRAAVSRPRELSDERLEQLPQAQDSMELLISAQDVRAAVASLPERLRDVLIEVYFRERSVAEAAEKLGVPAGTVKSRTFYALRALRELMDQRQATDPG